MRLCARDGRISQKQGYLEGVYRRCIGLCTLVGVLIIRIILNRGRHVWGNYHVAIGHGFFKNLPTNLECSYGPDVTLAKTVTRSSATLIAQVWLILKPCMTSGYLNIMFRCISRSQGHEVALPSTARRATTLPQSTYRSNCPQAENHHWTQSASILNPKPSCRHPRRKLRIKGVYRLGPFPMLGTFIESM